MLKNDQFGHFHNIRIKILAISILIIYVEIIMIKSNYHETVYVEILF